MFITLEGPEGAGKSTVATRLAEWLRGAGFEVVLTREPGATALGRALRAILLESDESLSPRAELLTFLADRAQHVDEILRPAIARGAVILCDRFTDSTLAYQGYARGLDLAMLRQLNDVATGGLTPDLTLLLDLDPSAGIGRLTSKDRMDALPLDFHLKVREGFLAESANDIEGRWRKIDASRAPDDVFESCRSQIQAAMASRGRIIGK